MNTLDKIKKQIATYKVLLYMKGTPQFPMCGFSAKVTQILAKNNVEYAFVNILENPDIRQELPKYADWPTFPQLYINQELIGGCDIISELEERDELLSMLQHASAVIDDSAKIVAAEI